MKLLTLALASFVFSATTHGETWPIQVRDAKFEERWFCDPGYSAFSPIAQTLVANKIQGCGVFYWSESEDFENIYLVACYNQYANVADSPTSYVIVKTDAKRIIRVRKEDEKSVAKNISKKPSC